MNKKKKLYLGIGIGLLALAGGYYWYTTRKKKQPEAIMPEPIVSDSPKTTTITTKETKPTKGSVPFSKIETTQVKIQPMQPLLTSGSDLTGKKIYSIYGNTTIYSTDGKKMGTTIKNEYLGTVKKVDRMANGVYWVYFVSRSGQMNKMASNLLNVEV